jgi:hypothetical protein
LYNVKKIPGVFIILNNKYQAGYIKVFLSLKRILTLEEIYTIKTIDFEDVLINSINIVFAKIKLIGCLFHFVKKIQMNLGKKGLLIKDFDDSQFLKELSHLPFIYNENTNYFNDIILKYKKQYKKKETIYNLIVKFEEYFKSMG